MPVQEAGAKSLHWAQDLAHVDAVPVLPSDRGICVKNSWRNHLGGRGANFYILCTCMTIWVEEVPISLFCACTGPYETCFSFTLSDADSKKALAIYMVITHLGIKCMGIMMWALESF